MSSERTKAIMKDVDHTKEVMSDNISKMVDNREKVQELQENTEAMAANAQQFKKQATEVKSVMWWKNCKLTVVIILVIVVIICIIAAAIAIPIGVVVGRNGGKCFPGESKVLLEGGRVTPISDVKTGDSIFTVDTNGNTAFSKVFAVQSHLSQKSQVVTIKLKSGLVLEATDKHLMLVHNENNINNNNNAAAEFKNSYSLTADAVQVGMTLFSVVGSEVVADVVVDVQVNEETGDFFAPFTTTGTIIVDGVVASCYAPHMANGGWQHRFIQRYVMSAVTWLDEQGIVSADTSVEVLKNAFFAIPESIRYNEF